MDINFAVECWSNGLCTRFEMYNILINHCDTNDNIDNVMNVIPTEDQADFITHLQELFDSESDEPVRIMGGIYSWETENDPVRRQELYNLWQADEAIWALRQKTVIGPAVRTWLRNNVQP